MNERRNDPDRFRDRSPGGALSEELELLMARMQTPEARKAAAALGSATPEELGEAVLEGFKRDAIESKKPSDSNCS